MADIHVINMGWGDAECVLCGQSAPLDYSIPYFEGPVHQEIGSALPSGDVVGGMTCCKTCHDLHYATPAQPPVTNRLPENGDIKGSDEKEI